MPIVSASLENPEVTVNGQKIVFHVKMKSGMWLEFNSPDDCKLYGLKGEIPILAPGENEISFSGRGSQGSTSGYR
ncbi:MAG: hypothetical protein AB2L20_00545 [Mangrovibacterium sp.]